VVILCLGAAVVGCSVFNKEDDYVPKTADKLYTRPVPADNKQDYEGAAKKFREVTARIPIPTGRAKR
jgi:outer membrane protein assembly factor BamD (BamD/ComL family)